MAKRRPRRRAKGARGRKARAVFSRRRLAIFGAVSLLVGLGLAWTLWPFWQLSARLDEVRTTRPSRLYGRALELEVGALVKIRDLESELELLGYRRTEASPASAGGYRIAGGVGEIFLRSRPTVSGWQGPARVVLRSKSGRITSITLDGRPVESAGLEAPVLATFVGQDRREKRPVSLEEVPEALIHAVLAAEDAAFFKHSGLSLRGMARAAWANLRDREVQQGGSTLTQQLVKNVFLTHERTLARKLREIVLAVLVDWRYDKQRILNGYLNEIYWGSSDSVSLIGVGAASWAYFGKRAHELDLCESALLAGMIHSPGSYSLRRTPERALERRNWVLARMSDLGWLSEQDAERGSTRDLCYSPHPVPVRSAPYFLDLAAAEAASRYRIGHLETAGYDLLSTLDHRAQSAAEESVAWGLEALEKGSTLR